MEKYKEYLTKKMAELKGELIKRYSLGDFNSKDTKRISESMKVVKKELEEQIINEKVLNDKEICFCICNEDYIF